MPTPMDEISFILAEGEEKPTTQWWGTIMCWNASHLHSVISQSSKLESCAEGEDKGLLAECKLLLGVNENGQLSLGV